jgi:RNA polymerase sigma-70 factor (ECF subfamily)
MHDLSDQDLVTLTREGEPRAFGELMQRYQASVFNVCLRMMGERREAEDMTQEAFIRAHERLHTFDRERPFGPWIRRVAANFCLNHIKRNVPPPIALDDELDLPQRPGQLQPEQAVIKLDQQRTIREALLALPANYRAVIELRHFQELSYAEIGAALGLPLSDVKSHLFRARKQLAQRLEGHV